MQSEKMALHAIPSIYQFISFVVIKSDARNSNLWRDVASRDSGVIDGGAKIRVIGRLLAEILKMVFRLQSLCLCMVLSAMYLGCLWCRKRLFINVRRMHVL